MRHIRALLTAFILAAPAAGFAQMHDYSLSQEETMRNGSNTGSTSGLKGIPPINAPSQSFENDVTRRIKQYNSTQGIPMTPPPISTGDAPPPDRFMDRYCDPSFLPTLTNNRKYYGQESCLQQERDDSCARFKTLPQEVKDVLDDAIGCMFANGNSYVAEKSQRVDNHSVACSDTYVRRLEMLKKYMGDAYSAYALVYLPDNVLDTSGACVNRQEQ